MKRSIDLCKYVLIYESVCIKTREFEHMRLYKYVCISIYE